MRILVADDSADNRELLAELLRTRGHSVAGVRDGREALAALEKASFDLVIMDEQMPGMNGIEATRAIHGMNASRSKRPMIVGVSGNSTEADERRCLEAGMDAFLAKPIGMQTLFQVLDLLAQRPQEPAPGQTGPMTAGSVSEGLSAHLHRATGGDVKILRSLVSTFLADAPKKLSVLRCAVARKDAGQLASIAHSLKGSLLIFGAEKAAAAALKLQALGRSGSLAGAAAQLRALEEEFGQLRRALLGLQAARRGASTTKRKPATKPGPRRASRLASRTRRKRKG